MNVLLVHGPAACSYACSGCDGEHHWLEECVVADEAQDLVDNWKLPEEGSPILVCKHCNAWAEYPAWWGEDVEFEARSSMAEPDPGADISHVPTIKCNWHGYLGGAGYEDGGCSQGQIVDLDTCDEPGGPCAFTGDTCPNCDGIGLVPVGHKCRGPMALLRQRARLALEEEIATIQMVSEDEAAAQTSEVIQSVRKVFRLIDALEATKEVAGKEPVWRRKPESVSDWQELYQLQLVSLANRTRHWLAFRVMKAPSVIREDASRRLWAKYARLERIKRHLPWIGGGA